MSVMSFYNINHNPFYFQVKKEDDNTFKKSSYLLNDEMYVNISNTYIKNIKDIKNDDKMYKMYKLYVDDDCDLGKFENDQGKQYEYISKLNEQLNTSSHIETIKNMISKQIGSYTIYELYKTYFSCGCDAYEFTTWMESNTEFNSFQIRFIVGVFQDIFLF
jgi:hypothetical protein